MTHIRSFLVQMFQGSKNERLTFLLVLNSPQTEHRQVTGHWGRDSRTTGSFSTFPEEPFAHWQQTQASLAICAASSLERNCFALISLKYRLFCAYSCVSKCWIFVTFFLHLVFEQMSNKILISLVWRLLQMAGGTTDVLI